MSEIVSLSLSSETEMVSHLCQFLRLDHTTTEEVRNSTINPTGFGFASVAHAVDIEHPMFATWQRRVRQNVHFRKIVHDSTPGGDDAMFDATAAATELGIQTMLEMYTESTHACNNPLVQWIDSIAFSYRVHTRLTAVRLRETIHSKMTRLDRRVRITSIDGPVRKVFVVHCEITAVWELPDHVIALSNVSDERIAVLPFPNGSPSPRVNRIAMTVLAATSAIELIRNCNFRGVAVNKWRGESHIGRDRSAARTLVLFSTRSHIFKTQ